MQKVIIDTDPGIDDAIAIYLALASPKLEVLGLTITQGNLFDIHKLAKNALQILETAGRSDIPVYISDGKPYKREKTDDAAFVHGENGIGGVELKDPKVSYKTDMTAAEFIVDTCVNKFPSEVVILAIGPLTNLALALDINPELPQYVGDVYVMGGAVGVPGNRTGAAEANAFDDPEAFKVTLHAGWSITLVALNLTDHIERSEDWFNHLATQHPIGDFINRMMQQIWAFRELINKDRSCCFHDPTTVVALIEPELFTSTEIYVDIETEGTLCVGCTVGDWRKRSGCANNVRLLTEVVDEDKYFELVTQLILSLPNEPIIYVE
eukprot:TRINITY_DN2033_c0_g1_i1.p1 TRINITY_DN2033_c0_g1~~TRINITY_DN2033_c0_g1_i1.p1  ORF type:complete len:323 (-),score=75.18 TRINITY_DN2033_c0_g1_i1:37-1005(-)